MPTTTQDDKQLSPAATARSLHRYQLFDGSYNGLIRSYGTEIAASAASLGSTFSTYPLDAIKTRMQSHNFGSAYSCIKSGYKQHGVIGFFKGVTAPMVSVTLVRTASFSIYQRVKIDCDELLFRTTGHSPLEHAYDRGAWPTPLTLLCYGTGGAVSGLLTVPVACPLELVKVIAQTENQPFGGASAPTSPKLTPPPAIVAQVKSQGQAMPKSLGTLAMLRLIYKTKGISGLYTGSYYHSVRDTIGTSIYFMTYESSKQLLANASGGSPTSPLAVIVAGGLCGLISWACTYPIDSAKTIYQRGIFHSPPGSAPFPAPRIDYLDKTRWRGLLVAVARSCVINAIFFSVFEFVKKQIDRRFPFPDGDGGDDGGRGHGHGHGRVVDGAVGVGVRESDA